MHPICIVAVAGEHFVGALASQHDGDMLTRA